MVEVATLVVSVYEAGLAARLWDDAEQFLDRLRFAAERNVSMRAQIRTLIPSWSGLNYDTSLGLGVIWRQFCREDDGLKDLHLAAIRCVAAACTGFAIVAEHSLDEATEAWHPYIRWVVNVQPEDVIITFNYDRILDIINRASAEVRPRIPLFVSPMDKSFKVKLKKGKGNIAVCHMHGNVSWKIPTNGKGPIVIDRKGPVAHLHPNRAVIGTPGLGKLELSRGLLKPVWDYALASLEAADAVVFVGYRFPPSDSVSKLELLGRLKKNEKAKVHCVLGPSSPDVGRLRGMVAFTGKRLKDHEMFAEDFFAVFERAQLFE